MPTSMRRLTAARLVVIVVSAAGMVAAAAALILIWKTSAGTAAPFPRRIYETTSTAASLLLLAVTIVIAWRAGDHPPNIALALSFTFSFSNDVFDILCHELGAKGPICHLLEFGTFILGAGFYIRAAQRFPRKLTRSDIASSRTVWGRVRLLRMVLSSFLYPAAVWVFVLILFVIGNLADSAEVSEIIRLTIVLVGIVFIYIMYRTGDVEARRKVLWFLEIAVAALFIGLLLQAADAVLHGTASHTRAARHFRRAPCRELSRLRGLHLLRGILFRRY